MGDVVVELQPHSWALHGISSEEAFATLIAFGSSGGGGGSGGYLVVTLPHANNIESSTLSNPALYSMVDACRLQPAHTDLEPGTHRSDGVDPGPSTLRQPSGSKALARHLKTSMGMKEARVMSVPQLVEGLRSILASRHKHFHEVLFTRRRRCEANV